MPSPLKLYLAPMEGVVDWTTREMISSIAALDEGVDECVTEFIRVTKSLHPESVYYRYCPELKNASKTQKQVPVRVQLLGSDPEWMAVNALRAHQLGAAGIDLNFGCPAKTVNRHDGGAALLKTPERIYKVIDAVRKKVPITTPVSAKIRLGFEDRSQCLEIAAAVEAAGAERITIHCRTKVDGYRPPAYWEWIPKITSQVKIPVIANGEIWNLKDFKRCLETTGVHQFMIGRGAIQNPFIFSEIKMQTEFSEESLKQKSFALMEEFFERSKNWKSGHFAQARTKQWLKMISLRHSSLRPAFDQLKVITNPELFESTLKQLSVSTLK